MTKKRRPAAWLHTMQYEKGNGSRKAVTLTKENPFGKPGIDYSAGYPVTSEPLYRNGRRSHGS